jgi:hypothetical protein
LSRKKSCYFFSTPKPAIKDNLKKPVVIHSSKDAAAQIYVLPSSLSCEKRKTEQIKIRRLNMANLTIREIKLLWGSLRRRHHGNGVIDIYAPQQSTVGNGDVLSLPPPSLQIGDNNFTLMTISGGTNGSQIYTRDDCLMGNPVPAVSVGQQDINVVSIYLPFGGPGIGPPAVYVDAFNLASGVFIDDDFVSIFVDGVIDASLTTSVNYDGVISSTSVVNEVAEAFNGIGSLVFNQWQPLLGTETVLGNQLFIGDGSTACYLALYQTPESICPRMIYCPSLRYCPPRIDVHKCPPSVICPVLRPGNGCRNIDPVPIEIREEIWEIIKAAGFKYIYELASKINTAKVQKLLSRLPASRRKAITMMLKKMKSGK